MFKKFDCSKCVFNTKENEVYSRCNNMQSNPKIAIRNREFGIHPIRFYSAAILECSGFSENLDDLKMNEELLKMFILG